MRAIPLLCCLAVSLSANDDFFDAARKGDVAKVRRFLDSGVDVNAKWRYEQTALLMAAWRGHAEVAKLLLERGATVDVKDSFYGMTPLAAAAFNGSAEIVRMLLEKGAAGADDALLAGAQAGHAEVVKAVLAKGGLKPEIISKAEAAAARGKHTEIVELLKKAGVPK